MNNWLNIIQSKLLPPRCIFCGQPGFADLDLCKACFNDLPKNTACCYRCGEHFELMSQSAQLCGTCLKKSPGFDTTHAPYLYSKSLAYLITQLKFHQNYKHARVLGTLLARYIAQTSPLPKSLIPVPLHPNRYRERGFNQSLEIARHLSRQLSIPMDLNACIRNKDTAHQTELPAKQRQKNLFNAFTVIKPPASRHVAIIDDVMTTGSTASALAHALKNSGVSQVDVWVCARA